MRTIIVSTIIYSLLLLVSCEYDEPSIDSTQYSFIKEGKTWICNLQETEAPYAYKPYTYKMMGDTTLKMKKYKKVYMQNKSLYGDWNWHYFCAVREKGEQVYIIYNDEKEEYLLYDFGITVYEENKEGGYITYNNKSYLVCIDVRQDSDNGRRKYLFTLRSPDDGGNYIMRIFTWTEGVGNDWDPFSRDIKLMSNMSYCYEGDNCIYSFGG